MRSQNAPLAGSEFDNPEEAPTDNDLGIAEPDPEAEAALAAHEAAKRHADAMATILTSPAFAAAVDAAVEARLKAMGATLGSVPAGGNDLTALIDKLAQAIDRSSNSAASQQPGYVKPLSADEIERRAEAFVEMQAILKEGREKFRQGESGLTCRPTYLLKDYLHAADRLWFAGDTIFWDDIPNTEMEPQNDIAKRVYAAFERWLGGGQQPSLIDQVIAARNERLGIAGAPSLPDPVALQERRPGYDLQRQSSRIEQVPGTIRQDIGPTRTLGTIVPEHPMGNNDPRRVLGTVVPLEMANPGQGV